MNKISTKMFLRKASSKISAIAFLQQYREFLTTGEVAELTAPIIQKVDCGELFPTPALEDIRAAVLAHHITIETRKAEEQLLNKQEQAPSEKNYTATVFTKDGQIATRLNNKGQVEEMTKSFNLPQEGYRFLDRRLTETGAASDNFGVLQSNKVMIGGELQSEVILRGDAIARVFRKPRTVLTKKTGTRDSSLSFGMKVSQDHSHFSHG